MDFVTCSTCGASIPVDDNRPVGFCTSCGAKIQMPKKVNSTEVSDSVILDYYVNAVESEIYNNRDLAIQNYKKILEYRSDFSPAKRGLARLNLTQDEDSGPEDSNCNVTVKFTSIKPYTLFVSFNNEEDEVKMLSLVSGDVKGVKLKTLKPYTVSFQIGRREYTRGINIGKKKHITIEYVFDGKNHINIIEA